MHLLHQYSNGGYIVSIFDDGTKKRECVNINIPPEYPEQIDLKITDWCDAGCAWCHEGSTKRGKHANIEHIFKILSPLPKGFEIAIGGGDPLSHPDFSDLVTELRDMGFIPNVTVNGRHLERHKSLLTKLINEKSIFGVGISVYKEMPTWDYENMVVHMIAGVDGPEMLDDIDRKKILVLGFKNFGRGTNYKNKYNESVIDNLNRWYRELFWIAKEHHLSFDTLAISQLRPERLFLDKNNYNKRFMGNEGEFSLYLDAVNQEYALSSYSKDRFKWTDIKSMYQHIRLS
jgi:organic radical activating enzyme